MRALVFGSLNIDYVYSVDHIVAPGETLDSASREVHPGGKGLNQAVALARAGLDTSMAGAIGPEGKFLKDLLDESGVDTDLVKDYTSPTGHAIIQVDANGKNSIVLFGGTNRMITEEFISEAIGRFDPGDLLLIQNEINLNELILRKAKEAGMKIAVNPSPMNEAILSCPLEFADLLLLNEVEGSQISGISEDDPEGILAAVRSKYPDCDIVLTLGGEGSCFLGSGSEKIIRCPAEHVKAVDTTGAGDTFTGYFLAGWMQGEDIESVMHLASRAAAIAVGREGAASSIPKRCEL